MSLMNNSILLLIGFVAGLLLATLGIKFEWELMRGFGAFVLLFLMLVLPTVLGRNS